MKFSVLAVDFDGTIAHRDSVDPAVRNAIAELRAAGIAVVLATGRILEDLRRVAGELHFVDAVVAENGAVIQFPDSGYTTVNGDPPSEAFLTALKEDGVRIDAGRVVVEAEAADAPRILAIIRRLELPLVLAFNRGRVMVLPQAISKATGVRQVLSALRLSPRNTVGIGDAENDHELLRLCEVGLAVDWGSPALKGVADFVLPGDGPWAVAPYIRALANRRRVPAPLKTRRQLLIGHADDGSPLSLAVRGRNVLVAGDSKSGKSWVAGLLCEQLILQGYCLCIIDPEGDYRSLETLPGVTAFGGADPLPRPMELLRALRHADVSIVIDLSHVSYPEKQNYIRAVLPALATMRRHTGLPHRIVVDEAHQFLRGDDAKGLLDLEYNSYTLVSYRSSGLPKDVLSASQAVIVTRESDPAEVRALFSLCAACQGRGEESSWHTLLQGLVVGEAVVLPLTDEAQGHIRRIRLAPRLTPHVRHLSKYIDIPVSDARAFVFWRDGTPTTRRARTLRELVDILSGARAAEMGGHLHRGDFSRWIGEVFGDYPLAASVRGIEQAYTHHSNSHALSAIIEEVRGRYEFLDPAINPGVPAITR